MCGGERVQYARSKQKGALQRQCTFYDGKSSIQNFATNLILLSYNNLNIW